MFNMFGGGGDESASARPNAAHTAAATTTSGGGGRGSSPQSYYIWGGPGCGKTYTMDLFYDNVEFTNSRKRRVHFHHFMIGVHKRLHKVGKLTVVAQEIAESADLLCFDEFQVTDIADAMMLKQLFEQLFAAGTTVVATSNRHPDELYKNGLQRVLFLPFIDYLKQRCRVLEVASEQDYRLRGGVGLGMGLEGDAATSAAASGGGDCATRALERRRSNFLNERSKGHAELFHTLFQQACGGSRVVGEVLSVYGHSFTAPEAVPDKQLAKFSFDAICDGAYGAADYIEVGERYKTIFLYDVPQVTIIMST